jgi:hypothetical protein
MVGMATAEQRGVLARGLCRVGLLLGCQQCGAQLLGVKGRCLVEERRERERFLAASASGSSPPSSPNCRRQKEGICKSLGSKRKSPAGLLPPLVGLQKREKEKDRKQG